MGNPIKFIGCLIKGHIIDPKESIMLDVMINPNNLLCPCYRCGYYIAYDSSSGICLTLTKKQAYKFKNEFIRDMQYIKEEYINTPEEIARMREQIYGGNNE